jgi:hypothetical protein
VSSSRIRSQRDLLGVTGPAIAEPGSERYPLTR